MFGEHFGIFIGTEVALMALYVNFAAYPFGHGKLLLRGKQRTTALPTSSITAGSMRLSLHIAVFAATLLIVFGAWECLFLYGLPLVFALSQ